MGCAALIMQNDADRGPVRGRLVIVNGVIGALIVGGISAVIGGVIDRQGE